MGKKSKSAKVKVSSSKVVYEGPVFKVTQDLVKEPGASKAHRRDIVRHHGSVVIMAVDDTGKEPRVLLARQYRHPANDYLWELPAGSIDEGEEGLPAARRELIEETGFTAKKWKRVLYFWSSPGFLEETMSVYMATGLTKGDATPEEDENITVRFFPLSQAVKMATTGGLRDGKTIASILWLDHSRRQKGTK